MAIDTISFTCSNTRQCIIFASVPLQPLQAPYLLINEISTYGTMLALSVHCKQYSEYSFNPAKLFIHFYIGHNTCVCFKID